MIDFFHQFTSSSGFNSFTCRTLVFSSRTMTESLFGKALSSLRQFHYSDRIRLKHLKFYSHCYALNNDLGKAEVA